MILAASSDDEMRKWITALCRIAPCTADWITQLPSIESENSEFHPTDSTLDEIVEAKRDVPIPPEYELNQIDEDNIESNLGPTSIIDTLQEQKVEMSSVIVIVPDHSQEVKQETVQTEAETLKQTEVKEPRGGAPFLRGSSGYDFGSKIEKSFHAPEPIAEEDSPGDASKILSNLLPSHQQDIPPILNESIDPSHSNKSSSLSWTFSCLCREILPRIGTRLQRRFELFSHLFPERSTRNHDPPSLMTMMNSYDSSTLFDFQQVKELLMTTSQHITLSYPYLPSSGCNWLDILKYLRYAERNEIKEMKYLIGDGVEDESEILIRLECSLFKQTQTLQEIDPHIHQFDVTTCLNSDSWIDDLTQKVRNTRTRKRVQLSLLLPSSLSCPPSRFCPSILKGYMTTE
jgi:hypothetical protein